MYYIAYIVYRSAMQELGLENFLLLLYSYSGTPHLRPPPKSEWGGLKRGVVSREGFATFDTRGRLQRLRSTLGGAYNQ